MLQESGAQVNFERGLAYWKMDRALEAGRHFKKALQLNFHHWQSYYALSLVAISERQPEEARRFFIRGMRFDSKASESVLYFANQLRHAVSALEASQWSLWCFEQLESHQKASRSTQFELAKLLFERSEFERSGELFKQVVHLPEYAYEATQYLSYILERLFKGEQLIEETLKLATQATDKADLFFNLGMVSQYDEAKPDLSLHFLYLASEADRSDPGLKFSLEQACLDTIGKISKVQRPEQALTLMIAHLYHGSVALAERYAAQLRDRWKWTYPGSFQSQKPTALWQDWLLVRDGLLDVALESWFGKNPVDDWRLSQRKAKD